MSKKKDPYQCLLEEIHVKLLGLDREIHELIRIVHGAREDPWPAPKARSW